MIRGDTKNIGINPVANKNVDPDEVFVPVHIDLRNGYLTDGGYWAKRPGYSTFRDVGVDESIHALIPAASGYAITFSGRIYDLTVTPTELTGARLSGDYRPTWDRQGDEIAICDGGAPVKISGGISSLLADSPPRARFISRLGSYTIMSGHDDTEVKYSAPGNFENWTSGGAGFFNVKKTGEIIRNQIVHRERLFLFKDKSIEIWTNVGGSSPFVRHDGLYIEKGTEADYSVVQANDTIYWLGDDLDFYVLAGQEAKEISRLYREEITKLHSPGSVYGLHFRNEKKIRWFAPFDGKCFVFDYVKNIFSEDNAWAHGQFERMPINSYMELNNKQYFGDYEGTGNVYQWSHDFEDDNGAEIRMYRRFKLVPSPRGHNVKVNRLRFRVKRGVATDGETTPEAFWRYRLDKGPWSVYEHIDLGVKGDDDPWVDFTSLGTGRELEIELVETDAVDFLVTNMNLTVRELGA